MTDEEFIDTHIAPDLLRLANLCKERGLPLVSCVQYGPGDTLETCTLPDHPGIKSLMAYWGVKAHGNIDSFMIVAQRHAVKHGHQSAILNILKVPTTPVPRDDSAS
jgi:hypothetical protein